ncbi:hypothetical protein NDU88_012694 [Pleurodeles waltl]|uniref:Uncharacterized protein n=1 Tax=Pleurodeles waltl TaxID=8319 RepID=A0AAV7R3Y8_PLEWA|nr:hypothetical protein NDU88_012694 [Pleurodeles waltl]
MPPDKPRGVFGVRHPNKQTMARKQEPPKRHTVKLQQKYWVDETSEAKVLDLGAICTGKVIERLHYYDTSTFQLAANQMWLSQKNQQWHLIIGPQNSAIHQGRTPTKAKGFNNSKNQKHSKGTHREKEAELRLIGEKTSKRSTGKDAADTKRQLVHLQTSQACQHLDEQSMDQPVKASISTMDLSGTYEDLSNEEEMIEYLALALHTNLARKVDASLDMQSFLRMAGVQHYASFHTTREATYQLQDTCTITIDTDEASSRKAGVISLDVDVLNIASGFDAIEKLANELAFQPLQE